MKREKPSTESRACESEHAKCGVREGLFLPCASAAGVQVRSKAAASLPVEGARPVGPVRVRRSGPFRGVGLLESAAQSGR